MMETVLLNRIKKFIEEHLKEPFSLQELAENAGYSAFHLAREFKEKTTLSIMEYTRSQRIQAAAKDLEKGVHICDVAMDYCFETHAGFTKAFRAEFGCTPKEFQDHTRRLDTMERGFSIMDKSKITIRHICKDDVQDLWENVYSAMTPRQITEDKILPALEAYKRRDGFELVAEVDGTVIMSLPLTKPTWIPLGFVWDNNFTLTGGDGDIIMQKLIDETKKQAKMLGITALLSPQEKDSKSSEAMQSMGFHKVFESGEWEYLMISI